jgi:proliferating cell nuclear antigen
MFEAKIADATTLRKLIEAIKDLVKNANIDVSPNGISIQAMDSSHVALVSLNMKQNGFESYRCDKAMTLGLSIENISKILKCAGNDDYITLHCEEEPSSLSFTFESKSKPCFYVDGEKISEFSLNLMHLDTEQLGIPDDAFTSECTMPASEFARICKEFGGVGDSSKQSLIQSVSRPPRKISNSQFLARSETEALFSEPKTLVKKRPL